MTPAPDHFAAALIGAAPSLPALEDLAAGDFPLSGRDWLVWRQLAATGLLQARFAIDPVHRALDLVSTRAASDLSHIPNKASAKRAWCAWQNVRASQLGRPLAFPNGKSWSVKE